MATTTATIGTATNGCGDSDSEWWQDPVAICSVRQYAHVAGLLFGLPPSSPALTAVGAATTIPAGGPSPAAVNVTITLQPSMFPQELYEFVWGLQPAINSLLDAVSRDFDFLREALERVVKSDDFTRRLFQLLVESRAKTAKPKPVFGIHRADYLLDYRKGMGQADSQLGIKQVEVNTVSASFGGMTQGQIQNFHQYVGSRYFGRSEPYNLPGPSVLADGFAVAWKLYGKQQACVLFVVLEEELNIYDQRVLEFDLWKRYGVKTIRRTFKQLNAEACLNDDQELFVCGHEVAVVYYRTAYTPEQHASEEDWSTRLVLECSRAAVCPPIAYQLVGTKKIQQVLAAPGVLERYVKDSEDAEKIRSIFTGLYSLDMGAHGDEVVERALENCDNFVLKPQREGGGNNYYGEELHRVLSGVRLSEERESYILMERILPPSQPNLVLNGEHPTAQPCSIISELGIFGLYVRHGDEVLLNKSGGWLCRSKVASSDEGGIMIRTGTLDSVNLVPTNQFLNMLSKTN